MVLQVGLWSVLRGKTKDDDGTAQDLATAGLVVGLAFILIMYMWLVYALSNFSFSNPNAKLGIALLVFVDPSIAVAAAYLFKK